MTVLNRWRLVCIVVLCLACFGLIGGASTGVVAQETETPTGTTNETVQHERPESVAESGDPERLQQWLSARLNKRLGSSTVALSQGEYEQARSVLGDDYNARLGQYVDVAGETSASSDDEAGETYRKVSEEQQELATQVQQFEEANETYQEARAEGNTTAARAAARRMDRIADRVETTGGNVTQSYRTLENQTGTDTSEQQAIVTNVTQDVVERQREIRAATFVETKVTVINATEQISFTEPLQVTARVETVNGTTLANQTLTIAVNGQTRAVKTDSRGQFNLSYRPRTLPLDISTIQLEYVPRNESVYLESNASVPVDVKQVTPTLRLTTTTNQTRFGQQTGTSVVVTVDGQQVDRVPVVATLESVRLGQAITDGAGEARVASRLPASVPVGDQQLQVSIPLQNRAIRSANKSADVRVQSTATTLTVAGEQRNGDVTVTGKLTTAEGQPIAGTLVGITRNGTTVTTARTGPNGTYAATIPLGPNGRASGPAVQIVAQFDRGETNLDSSRAVTTFAVTRNSRGGDSEARRADSSAGSLATSRALLLVAALIVLGLAIGGYLLWRRRIDEESETPASVDQSSPASTNSTEDDAPSALDRAEVFLDRGAHEAAVRAAYAGLRNHYLDDSSSTHWTLLERAQTLSDDERTAMEQVVHAYELLAFSPADTEDVDAPSILSAARTALGHDGVDTVQDD